MKNFKKMNRKAVSPIIATLLLVAIAVAAAVITYSWTMNMVRNQGEAAQTSLKLDQVFFDLDSIQNITAIVRNSGSVPTTINEARILTNIGDNITLSNIAPVKIGIGATEPIVLAIPGNSLEAGLAYQIQFWTTNGYFVEGVFFAPKA